MHRKRSAGALGSFVLFISLAYPPIVAAAGDPVAGKTLFNTPYSGLSCGTSGCHGGYTGSNNPNKIVNGANNPTLIQSAINNNTGGMGVFQGKFSATDLDNIAAYIANPNAAAGSPAVSLSPASLTFGSQNVGSTSAAKSITFSNTGTAALNVTSITAPAYFSQTNNCGTSVAAGGSCTINVTFTPAAVTSYSGTITINDNATGSPHTVAVSGSGGGVAQVSVAPAGLNFSQTVVGQTSATQTVTLSNTGSGALSITSIAASGDFTQTNTCGATLAPNTSCAIGVVFAPTAAGSRTGTLTVTDSATGSPHTASLSATAVAPAAVVSLSTGSLGFGSQAVGTTSAAKTVTISNPGTAALTGVSIVASGDFAQTNSCGASVAQGGNCTITVTFTPAVSGARSGAVTIADNLGTQTVGLSGTGGTAPTPAVSLTAVTPFASQTVGNTSAPQTITLTNSGNAALTVSGMAVGSADFVVQSNNCGTSVAAGASCSIGVAFKPTAAGPRSDTLTVTDNAAGSPHTVALSGTGVPATASIALSPTSLTFASQSVGTASTAQTVTLSNIGNSALTISSIAVPSDYTQSNNCGTSVAAGASCTINASFKPTTAGARNGAVTISDNATGSPHTIALSGTATAALIQPPTTATGYVVHDLSTMNSANGIVAGPDNNLWITETSASKIGIMTIQGTLVNEYPAKTANSQPKEIVVGPDGNLWFTEYAGNKIGKITTSGVITEYTAPTANSQPSGIAVSGQDLWFTEAGGNKIGRIDVNGVITEYSTGLSPTAGLGGIVAAKDGSLWFTETANRIGKIDPLTGTITEYPLATTGNDPTAITLGSDGALWFTMKNANKIGRIDPATGAITEYPGLSPGSGPTAIVAGASGYIWFTETVSGKVAGITTAGAVIEYSVSGASVTQPTGIAVAPDGNLWVLQPSVNKVLVMSTSAPTSAPSAVPSPAATTPATNIGAGGGCTVGNGLADAALPLLLAFSLLSLARRRR